MTSKSKIKGNGFEREVVKIASKYDSEAIRARGSDGRSLGRDAEVDLVIFDYGWSAKRRKKISKYLMPGPGCLGTIIREDYGEPFALVPLEWLLELMKNES